MTIYHYTYLAVGGGDCTVVDELPPNGCTFCNITQKITIRLYLLSLHILYFIYFSVVK